MTLMRPTPERIADTTAAALRAEVVGPGTRAILFHDMDVLDARLDALASAFPAHALHAIAVKANPVVAILRRIVGKGFGLECASIEEVELALAAGCAPEHVVFDSPAKTRPELRRALMVGVRINSDNVAELERIDALRAEFETTSILGLRVNPNVGTGSIAATSVAGERSKFGVAIGDAAAIYARFPWLNAIHAHVGSQGCTLEQLLEAAERVAALRQKIGTARISSVDIGGGLPVIYHTGHEPPTFQEYGDALRARAPSLCAEDVQIVTEFGRAVHANSGWGLSQIEYVKDQDEAKTAVTHFGADLLLRPVYNPEDWSHEFLALDPGGEIKRGESASYRLAGPLCFGGDIIGKDVALPEVAPGEWLAIRDVGAYTLSMWSRHCSRGMPAVVGVWRDGEAWRFEELRGAESPGDIVAFWS